MICISYCNKKLGSIASIDIAVGLSCRIDAPCSKDCYATKGAYNYENVKQKRIEAYAFYKQNGDAYFDEIIKEFKEDIKHNKRAPFFVRWHSTGDIVDEKYFDGVVRVAKTLKKTKFLIFTKKFEIVNKYVSNGGAIPKNLVVVFSRWGRFFKVDNPNNFPMSYIRFKENCKFLEEPMPSNALECIGSCDICQKCFKMKKGASVIFDQH